jgi:hypothetical protein
LLRYVVALRSPAIKLLEDFIGSIRRFFLVPLLRFCRFGCALLSSEHEQIDAVLELTGVAMSDFGLSGATRYWLGWELKIAWS